MKIVNKCTCRKSRMICQNLAHTRCILTATWNMLKTAGVREFHILFIWSSQTEIK